MNYAEEGDAKGDHDCFERSLRDAREHRHKLYGRDVEAKQLQLAYQRVKSTGRLDTTNASEAATATTDTSDLLDQRTELVLISGSIGVGKSGLAHSVRSHVEDVDRGYFICAEFDSVETREPYQALAEAFSVFATCVDERGDNLYFKEALREHGFANSNILFEMIPALQRLIMEGSCKGAVDHKPDISIGKVTVSDPVTRIFSGGDFHCFKETLSTFVRAIGSRDKPIVLLLDNLHLANECSLHAIQALIENKDIRGVLFLATVASNVDEYSVSFSRILHKLRNATVGQATLELFPLNDVVTSTFFMEVLRCDLEKATSLLAILAPREKGNALFLWEFLHRLHKSKSIQVDVSTGQCYWNLGTLHRNIGSLLDGVRASVDDLSIAEKEYIKIMSCLGDKMDVSLLARLMPCSKEVFVSFMRNCADKGLLHTSHNSWCFSNRVVKAMVNDLMTDHEKRSCHYRIGRKMWRVFNSDELNDFIFLVVDQLTLAVDNLNDKEEKTAIAKLCFFAGVRAFHLSSFATSIGYLERGISLLGPGSWDKSYDLCLDLYSATAEVATSLGRYERVYEISGLVVCHARFFSDSVRVQTSMTHALGISGRHMEATKLAFELLQKLGEPFPSRPRQFRMLFELTNLRRRLKARSNESILRLPTMVDTDKLAAMQLLNIVFLPACNDNPGYVPLIAFRLVRLTLDFGLCPVSCLGFAAYAGILCSLVGDIKQGHRVGQLCLLLYEKFGCRSWLARLSVSYFDFVHGWVRPFEEVRLPMEYACRAGLESGDIEFAFTCGLVSLFSRFETDRLPVLAAEIDDIVERTKSYAAKTNVLLTRSLRQLIHNLMTIGKVNPHVLHGEFFDEDTCAEIKANRFLHPMTLLDQAMLALFFGKYADANRHGKEARVLVRVYFGPRSAFGIFTCGLVDVAYAQVSNRRRAPLARKCSRLLRRFATYGAPLNFIDKHYLLEAELAALANKPTDALILFNAAIATANQGKKRLQTALANERTARFLRRQGDVVRATEYFDAAIVTYRDYGAMAKALHLQNEMSHFAGSS